MPALVSMAEDALGCGQPWPVAPEPDFTKAALIDGYVHGSAQWWFSIDGSDRMDKILQGDPYFAEERHIRNWTRPSVSRLVAETFEHRMHLIGLIAAFEPWLKLADKFAAMGDRMNAGGYGPEPEFLIHHALLSGKDRVAEDLVRNIALGKTAEDLAATWYVREGAFAYRDTVPGIGLGRGPAIQTTHRVPLTRENLWLLYRFLDLIKAEIEDITGWTRGQINYGIRKWDLSNWSGSAVDTRWAIKERVAKAHGLPMTMENMEKIADLADVEIKRLRDLVLSCEFPWEPRGSDAGEIRPAELLASIERPEKKAA